MSNVKHIHEVLFLFQEKATFQSEEALFDEIKKRHGEDVGFTSCSNEPFGLDKVVDFLVNREKIVKNADGSLALHPDMSMCNGHENHKH
ncbi:putative metal-binding protein [Balneicella halophila]|uniref:Putative metal-binding protein n=1 Tax=Balneicella halophila TaxID=1537566 RepID=A0A7L4URE0_BALHA|nr:DUF2492 family protein [Balneicella halophila]PVX52338.1 putative metal-binding protein [Balneicella halophila]